LWWKNTWRGSTASWNPDDLILARADNYRRWVGFDWSEIEKGGEPNAGAWTKEEDQRLEKFVEYGHKLGYLVSFYCLDGYTADENQGWDADYKLGSRDAAIIRWKAAIEAKADYISTDHYEQLAAMIASGSR
jgi:hypothetical protein